MDAKQEHYVELTTMHTAFAGGRADCSKAYVRFASSVNYVMCQV
jgi:hypothetical protein